jgi:hypothetical protein
MIKEELIKKVRNLNFPQSEYAVFGSGPLAAHGIRETRDIDLVVIPSLYQKLKNDGWEEKEWPSGRKYLVKDEFEVIDDWDYATYHPDLKQIIKEAEIIDEVPFIKLEEVLEWKQSFGREKDLKDIQLIDNYLKNNS